MEVQYSTHIPELESQLLPVAPHDTMVEAGRKVLLADFVQMLKHEEGSRSGEDIEDVHDMRVAIRRMRSNFRFLEPYFKSSAIQPYARRLKKVSRALGKVRDLDLIIHDLKRYQEGLAAQKRDALQQVIDQLEARRGQARQALVSLLDDKPYRSLVEDFSAFLTSPSSGAPKTHNNSIVPHEVRHLAPVVIHQHLAAVRAYDGVIEHAHAKTLHALRIAFKHLRYTVSFFEEVLGNPIEAYIEDLKAIQDHLGTLNDHNSALKELQDLADGSDIYADALSDYIATLEDKRRDLRESFSKVWTHFNNRTTQRKLSDALLALR
jgi:CHAD domain-containing protein